MRRLLVATTKVTFVERTAIIVVVLSSEKTTTSRIQVTLTAVTDLGTAVGQPGGYPGPSDPITPPIVQISAYPAPNQPLPLPTALPIPTQPPRQLSPEAEKAVEFVANRGNVSADLLTVISEYAVEYRLLGKQFQQVTLVSEGPEGFEVYKLMVDLADGYVEEDIYALREAETQAHQDRYEKLEPILFTHLQTLNDDDEVPVAIWVAAEPGQTLTEQQAAIFANLALEYPEAQTSLERSGKPMDISDPELAERINTDYRSRLIEAMVIRTQPLITELKQRGYDIVTYEGMPSFEVVLPKWLIQDLSRRTEVSAVYLVEGETSEDMDYAIPNSLVPDVWNRGFDGTGVTIAILDRSNVDWNNTFLNHATSRLNGVEGVQDHATWVASVAASSHSSLKGMAEGATILSAGENGTPSGAVFALRWAIVDQNAPIVNYSGGVEYNDNELHWLDRAFDYWARQEHVLVIKSSGNTGDHISSPGRGWNVLTVGAYDDKNNLDWSDDQIWAESAYINPCGSPGDCSGREKPEVVASGVDVNALGTNNVPAANDGTSLAAPQVAGLGALLIHRAWLLEYWPEVSRAIIMASATHNVEKTESIIPDYPASDLKDGAGAINASLADTIAQNRLIPINNEVCPSSCWWHDVVDVDTFTEQEYFFYAMEGDPIRIAISWWSNPDTPGNDFSYDRLDLDLDLLVRAPDNSIVDLSTSVDNNYEMVEFQAPQTGTYRIVVDKYSANNDETVNWVGVALANTSHRVYLPIAIKD